MRLILFFFLLTCLCSCKVEQKNGSSITSLSPYRPAYGQVEESMSDQGEGDWKYHYKEACRAKTWDEAERKWEAFFAAITTEEGEIEIEDGYQGYRVNAAEFEMARIYYVLGKVEKGDQFLKKMWSSPKIKEAKNPQITFHVSVNSRYIPIYIQTEIDTIELNNLVDETWKQEHRAALASKNLGEACERYEKLLKNLTRLNRNVEDYRTWNHETLAAWELIRIYYLLGKLEKGDKLLVRLYEKNNQFGEWN